MVKLVMATEYYDRNLVNQRLEELAELESEILSELFPQPRIHS